MLAKRNLLSALLGVSLLCAAQPTDNATSVNTQKIIVSSCHLNEFAPFKGCKTLTYRVANCTENTSEVEGIVCKKGEKTYSAERFFFKRISEGLTYQSVENLTLKTDNYTEKVKEVRVLDGRDKDYLLLDFDGFEKLIDGKRIVFPSLTTQLKKVSNGYHLAANGLVKVKNAISVPFTVSLLGEGVGNGINLKILGDIFAYGRLELQLFLNRTGEISDILKLYGERALKDRGKRKLLIAALMNAVPEKLELKLTLDRQGVAFLKRKFDYKKLVKNLQILSEGRGIPAELAKSLLSILRGEGDSLKLKVENKKKLNLSQIVGLIILGLQNTGGTNNLEKLLRVEVEVR